MKQSERCPSKLVDHFFRHEYAKLVATLSRACGMRHLDIVEDIVQSSLVEALKSWQLRGLPENPEAWINRVAKNKLIDAVRRRQVELRLRPNWLHVRQRPEYETLLIDELFLDSQIADSQLRMIFACCHPKLNQADQIALTLRTLCGFDGVEVARALLIGEVTARKRIQRAKQALAQADISLDVPTETELATRLDVVHQVLYLIFNEGYFSSHSASPLRDDVCEEGARLCHLLTQHPNCATPTTFALLALMLFQAARREARIDHDGGVLRLEEQDRRKWDQRMIARAKEFLAMSASGKEFSRYHLEAGIAMHHSSAKTFECTPWQRILKLYDILVAKFPSPIYRLNRAIVVAQLEGPEAGLRLLDEIKADPMFSQYHWLQTVSAELHVRQEDFAKAKECFERAQQIATSPSEQDFIRRKLDWLASIPHDDSQ